MFRQSFLIKLILIVFLLPCITESKNPYENKKDESSKKVLPAPPFDEKAKANKNQKNTNRIIGGTISKGRPFIAALLYEDGDHLVQYCGASVIGDRWLLTAAHCKAKKDEHVFINRPDLSQPGGVHLIVVEVKNHPAYNSKTHDNDIALLKLSGDIPKSISRITIAPAPADKTRIQVAGYGLIEEEGKETSLQLREVDVPIVSNDVCKTKYADLTANMVCAGEEGKDSCQGDSGSAFFLEKAEKTVEQYGVVSFGVGCGRKGWPGVYTRVDRYKEWITNQIQ